MRTETVFTPLIADYVRGCQLLLLMDDKELSVPIDWTRKQLCFATL